MVGTPTNGPSAGSVGRGSSTRSANTSTTAPSRGVDRRDALDHAAGELGRRHVLAADELGEAGGVVRRELVQTHAAEPTDGLRPGRGAAPSRRAGVNRRARRADNVVEPTARERQSRELSAAWARPGPLRRIDEEDDAVAESPAVVPVEVTFSAVDTAAAGEAGLAERFVAAWPAYRRWYLRDGEAARPEYVECRHALAGVTCPSSSPPTTGWSLRSVAATWPRGSSATGTRPRCSRRARWPRGRATGTCWCATTTTRRRCATRWSCAAAGTARPVLAMSDCGLGALDGVNAHGLAVAIAFGGRRVVGDGFGIGIVVRYVLELAHDVPEALDDARADPGAPGLQRRAAGQRRSQRHRLPLAGPGHGGQRRGDGRQPAGGDRVAGARGVLGDRGPRGGDGRGRDRSRR